ncbi:MAG: alpha/beta fold hydrolase [Phycisphaerales bacterium]|nr:alpha/beta fold hydrolase [Phycisphaerales bacterium]
MLCWILIALALIMGGLVLALWRRPMWFIRRFVRLGVRPRGLRWTRKPVGSRVWPMFRTTGPMQDTVVILHGFGVDSGSMLLLAHAMVRKGRQVVVPDLPGFGDHVSGEVLDEAGMIQALEDLAGALGIERCVVMGSSMGGALAAAWAHAHPERIIGAVLLDPAGVEPPVENEIYAAARAGEHPLKVDSIASLDRILDLNFVTVPRIPRFVRRDLARIGAANADLHERILRSLEPLMLDGIRPRLGAIKQPVLLVWGEADRIIHPSAAGVWAEGLPDVEVSMLPRCGHVPWMDARATVLQSVEQFVERVFEQR